MSTIARHYNMLTQVETCAYCGSTINTDTDLCPVCDHHLVVEHAMNSAAPPPRVDLEDIMLPEEERR